MSGTVAPAQVRTGCTVGPCQYVTRIRTRSTVEHRAANHLIFAKASSRLVGYGPKIPIPTLRARASIFKGSPFFYVVTLSLLVFCTNSLLLLFLPLLLLRLVLPRVLSPSNLPRSWRVVISFSLPLPLSYSVVEHPRSSDLRVLEHPKSSECARASFLSGIKRRASSRGLQARNEVTLCTLSICNCG